MTNEREPQIALDGVMQGIVELLGLRPGRARFVAELVEGVRRAGGDIRDVEPSLAELEHEGAVLISENACSDPHLEGVDLRIAALVTDSTDGDDAQASAIAAIDAVWQRWLGEYLASHRCT